MSLRWIQENQEAPIVDEESSDIEDSSGDNTDDQIDLLSVEEDDVEAEGEVAEHRRQKRETFRHPTTTVSLRDIRRKAMEQGYDPNIPMGNPTYGPVMQLHSMTGYRMAILPCGKVRGLECECSPYAILKVTVLSFDLVVQIEGLETGLFLAMNARGRLYGERNKDKDNTTWQHLTVRSYDSYRSVKYADREWYAGIKSNGRPKNGRKTAINQKATKFLPIR
ncbi:fibroblast growth factor 1 [Neodiprion pinetum]|uniref:fibroblast growth factor 1 n=1 Tax=Neodiprion pinetum TaxID=441929 RepID=UPI001EE055C9|nr:fibroblast growth factor 1-like [Neodiprion pinetum]